MLKPAVSAVNGLEPIMPESASIYSDPELNKELSDYMIKMLQNNPDVYTLYYANEQGEFFLVGKRQRFEDDKKAYYFHKKIMLVDGKRIVTETWFDDSMNELETVKLSNDNYSPQSRPWYKKAVLEAGPIWTSPYIFFITKLPGITYAKPVYYKGVFSGVLAADLEISTISKFLMNSVFTKNTCIFAMDGSGNILAHSELYEIYGDKYALKDHIPTITDFGDDVMTGMKNMYDSMHVNEVKSLRENNKSYKTIIAPYSIYGLDVILGMYTPDFDYLSPLYKSYEALAIVACIILVLTIFISLNISRHLAKPFKMLSAATESAKELQFDKRINVRSNFREVSVTQDNFNQMLESLANYQSANQLLSETLHNAHIDTLYRLAMAAEHKDQYTYDHLKRVSDISVMLAEIMGLNRHDVEILRHASAMHDVGKLGIPDHILLKPGKLTAEEYDIIKTHSEIGAKILEKPSSEEMDASMVIALHHHEKWDGTGYPQGLAGENIPLFGRIVSIADVIDALLSQRPYKEPFTFEETIEIVRSEKGRHFDPDLADVILNNQESLRKIVS
jgi:putative two-component system response regulator